MAKKTTCPVTRSEFVDKAQPIEYAIAGVPLVADVKEFSTGSLGWNTNGKITLKVGEKNVAVQVGLNLTIVGSKDLPKDSGGEAGGDT